MISFTRHSPNETLSLVTAEPENFFDPPALTERLGVIDPAMARVLSAFARFLCGDVMGARAIAGALYIAEVRNSLLLDLLTRCQSDCGEFADALHLLHDNPATVASYPVLLGRAAALCFLLGMEDQADHLAKRLCTMSASITGDRYFAEREARSRYMRMTEEERALVSRGDLPDYYHFTKNQLASWHQYQEEFDPSRPRQRNGTMFLAHLVRDWLAALDVPFDLLIDFGCLYGGLDHWLAGLYPDKKVVGFDRSTLAIDLNRSTFVRPNLAFESGFFAKALPPYVQESRGSLLVHIRTTCLMYPDQLRRFYAQCAEVGISRIIGFEPWSYSEFTEGFVDFRQTADKTIGLGGPMMVHDYRSYLEEAGYEPGPQRLVYNTCYDRGLHPRNFAFMTETISGALPGVRPIRSENLPGMTFPPSHS